MCECAGCRRDTRRTRACRGNARVDDVASTPALPFAAKIRWGRTKIGGTPPPNVHVRIKEASIPKGVIREFRTDHEAAIAHKRNASIILKPFKFPVSFARQCDFVLPHAQIE